jgi:hypothetical protein
MAFSLPPLINGKSYEWADVVINILGVPFSGVTKISYDDTQEMENIYGAGNRPVSRAYGNFKPTASITILMEEMENIQAAATALGGVIQRIPEFDVTVTFVDSSLTPRTHTLKNCRFTKNTREIAQGDTSIACECPLILSHVEFV